MANNSVLIITEVFDPEEFLINDIARKWVSEGKKVTVLTRNPAYPFGKIFKGYSNKFYSKQLENGVTICRYHIIRNYRDSKFRKITNYFWNAILATSLAILLHRKNKNIFIYHTGPLTVALPGILLKKINKGRVVIWTQDVWPEIAFAYGLKKSKTNVWIIEKFVNFIYGNCDRIITTSRPVQKDVQKRVNNVPDFIPNWPMNVFQNGMELNQQTRTDQFTFTFAGNIGAMQNLDNIILAFHEWSAQRNDVCLEIYGDGSARLGLEQLLAKLKSTNIHLKGRVPVSTIPTIYKGSDVLIISLRKDEVLEKYVPAKFSTYLTAGRPIFGILSGAVKDYILEGNLGYVSNPQDLESIKKGLDYFIKLTSEEKVRIGERALELYNHEFNSEINFNKLSKIVFEN